MLNRFLRLCAVGLALACLTAGALRADTLYMTDGRIIEGKIVGKNDQGYIVEIASGARTLRVVYKFADVREIEMNPVTKNDTLMVEYNRRLVEAAQKGVDGYRDLARWCAKSDSLADERKSAWRAVIGLAPDDEEAHAALGLVKTGDGRWQSLDEKMAAMGFVRQGNTWVRGPNAGKIAQPAQAGNPPPPMQAAAPEGVLSTSVLERSGFNQLFAGNEGYTAEVEGPGVQNGTIFYGRSGYPYLEVYDAAGIGIFVPMYSYPGSYFLTLPPGGVPYFRRNQANLSLADRNLTGPFFPEPPATATVTQTGTTFEVPAAQAAPQDPRYNNQGYDQNGFKTGPVYRAPVPPTEVNTRDNLLVLDKDGNTVYQGANYLSHNAMGYDQNGFKYSDAKVVQTDAGVIQNGAGYNTYGLRYDAARAGSTPYIVNGAGYATDGTYMGGGYASTTVFMVNGAGYETGGSRIVPFYHHPVGGIYNTGYSRYSNFEVDLYGNARGTNYRVGINGYGVSFDLNGKKGNTAWSASFR